MNTPAKFLRNLVLIFSLFGVASCSADGPTTSAQTETTEVVADYEVSPVDSSIKSSAQFNAILLGGAPFDSAKVLTTQPLAFWFWAPG